MRHLRRRITKSALSTADPSLQTLAWDLEARVAIAEGDWVVSKRDIEKALAILDRFQIPTAAWRIHGTARKLYRHLKKDKEAETHRERAEASILALANSFAPDEPLRTTFLAAAKP